MKGKLEAVLFLLLLLIVCSKQLGRELKDTAIVTALGFDYGEEGYTVTAQIYDAKGSGSDGDVKYFTLQAAGATPAEALRLLDASSERHLFHKHNGIILFGPGITGAQLGDIAREIFAVLDIRLNINAICSEQPASELLNCEETKLDAGEFEAFLVDSKTALDCRVPLISMLTEQDKLCGWLPCVAFSQDQLVFDGVKLFGKNQCAKLSEPLLCDAAGLLTQKVHRLASGEKVLYSAFSLDRTNTGAAAGCYVKLGEGNELSPELRQAVVSVYALMQEIGAEDIFFLRSRVLQLRTGGTETQNNPDFIPLKRLSKN